MKTAQTALQHWPIQPTSVTLAAERENKVYRDRPQLCDGDGDLGMLRRWYEQFYEPRSEEVFTGQST